MAKISRQQAIITESESEADDYWYNQFINKLAVQPKSNIYEEINAILNPKSKYNSVEAVVQEMKERSGLTSYLQKLNKSNTENTTTKTAADQNDAFIKKVPIESVKSPIVIVKCPNIAYTIDNIIQGGKGNLTLPSILDRVINIHKSDVMDAKDWDDPILMGYISHKNLEEKQKYNNNSNETNLGKHDSFSNSEIDPANTDMFFGLMPTSH